MWIVPEETDREGLALWSALWKPPAGRLWAVEVSQREGARAGAAGHGSAKGR